MATIDTPVIPQYPTAPPACAPSSAAWWRWLRQQVMVLTPPAPRAKRVLIISYQFPPTGGSGVQRPAKLAKYLPAHGWSVEVLAAGHDRFPWADETLLEAVSTETRVHRIRGYEPACLAQRIASVFPAILCGTNVQNSASDQPEPGQADSRRDIEDALFWRLTRVANGLGLGQGESMWVGPAVRAAVRRHRETPFDAVISTGPPHFAHRVAMRVARATRLPWLADLRDPMASDFDRQGPSSRCMTRMQKLEAAVLQRADAIITTCPAFASDLQERYPRRAASIRAITNGFDRDDILAAIDGEAAAAGTPDLCEFVAAGSFYGRRELARIIRPLQQAIDNRPEWKGRVRFTIAGTIDAEQRRYWEKNKPEWVTLTGYVDHAAAIRLATRAACNILVVPACNHGHLSIPGKTFELLALPSHVLALVPSSGDTSQIVSRAGASTVAPFENTHAVVTAMDRIIEAYFAGRLDRNRDWRWVDAFDRRYIAGRFADALNGIMGSEASVSSSAFKAEIP
jgi:hypothetical protein